MRRWTIPILCAVAMACSTAPEPSGFGKLTLGLEACPGIQGGVLEPYEVCGFNVMVFKGKWQTGPPSKVFESGCLPYKGDQVTIENIESGSNRTVYYEMHTTPDCSGAPAVVGARGGIEIPDGESAGGIWHVPTFELGGFRGLPLFDPELRVRAAATPCATDDNCLGMDGNDHYILSPVAFCDTVAGHCTMPASLYPLNHQSSRAFHSAVGLDDGRIVIVGGLTRLLEGQIYNATEPSDPVIEVFDPATLTWSTLELEALAPHSTAFHKAVYLGGSKIALVGGVRRAEISIGDGAGGPGAIHVNVPKETGPQGENASDLVFVIDIDEGTAAVGSLSSARFMMDARLVSTAAGDRLFVTGGAIPLDLGRAPVQTTEFCALDEEQVSCSTPIVETATLSYARLGHCSICLDEVPGPACDSVFVYGGSLDIGGESSTVAETYNGAQFTPSDWSDLSAWSGQPFYPTCIRSGQRLYFVGGVTDLQQGPDVPA